MAYVLPADFRTETVQSWTQGLTLDESVTDAFLTSVIALVQDGIENDLNDTFEPPSPDNDVTLLVNSWGTQRLDVPRRIRSITTLKTRQNDGTLILQAATDYRVISSANNPDMGDAELDYVEILNGQTLTGDVSSEWPYGVQTVELVGKFGWSSTPNGIKRLTSLLVYDYIKPMDGRLRKTSQLRTEQGTYEFTPQDEGETGIREADNLIRRFRREAVLVR